jgi:hypothetical protein
VGGERGGRTTGALPPLPPLAPVLSPAPRIPKLALPQPLKFFFSPHRSLPATAPRERERRRRKNGGMRSEKERHARMDIYLVKHQKERLGVRNLTQGSSLKAQTTAARRPPS